MAGHDAREAIMKGRRTDGSIVQRPISPHLQAYDMLQMTSALSFANRATGVGWSFGLVFLVWWLAAAASGPRAFGAAQWYAGSWLGVITLFLLSGAAWFHTLNGVRHLFWDAGYGYDIPTTYRSGWMVLIGTAVLTVLTWVIAIIAWAR
ncbi:succinate dehydrogenase, cytochrome b556 subunit [Roseomonas sp. BN140053]|uniref:succinate dehydrogenase, cytochrome b556 subunit n=1 Tax=Roseomonas sp. BN140053 TaxID=3391898 RepID=UPI0039E9D763